jgi:hypothetical protein
MPENHEVKENSIVTIHVYLIIKIGCFTSSGLFHLKYLKEFPFSVWTRALPWGPRCLSRDQYFLIPNSRQNFAVDDVYSPLQSPGEENEFARVDHHRRKRSTFKELNREDRTWPPRDGWVRVGGPKSQTHEASKSVQKIDIYLKRF